MKKLLHTLLVLVCGVAVVTAQMLPNGDMEQWDTLVRYSEPVGWNTSALGVGVISAPDLPVEMAPGPTPADTAIRLRTVNVPFIGAVEGGFTNYNYIHTLGQYPFTSKPDTLTVVAQFKIVDGDTFNIGCAFFDINNPNQLIGGTFGQIIGQSNGWVEIKFPIRYYPNTNPGYVRVFGYFSSDPFKEGNVVEIDSLGFNVAEQVENNSFEVWEEVVTVDPVGWFSQNVFTQWVGDPPHVVPDTDAVSGQLSARIRTQFNFFSGGVGYGMRTRGTDIDEGFYPVPNRPSELKFMYKYTSADTTNYGLCVVVLHSNAPATPEAQKDTIAVPLHLTDSAWKQLQIDLTQTSLPSVDSILISFAASNTITNLDTNNVLKVDAIEMEFVTAVNDPIAIDNPYFLTPSLAHDFIQIHPANAREGQVRVDIVDTRGNVYYTHKSYRLGTPIDVLGLAPGMYSVVVYRGDKSYPLRFVKQ